MVGPNKILTVSYGTFSCTLEGFDDSFNAMKAIAEYFRDLAADDRYFGAEPPVPDAEMLARIAEREIERRVIGRIEGNDVKLSASPSSPAPAAQPNISGPQNAAMVPNIATASAQSQTDSGVASAAEKLKRIRSAVQSYAVTKSEAMRSAAPTTSAIAPNPSEFIEDQHADAERSIDTAFADLHTRDDAPTTDNAAPVTSVEAPTETETDLAADDFDIDSFISTVENDEANDAVAPAPKVDAATSPVARVIKVKKADLERALDSGELEELFDDESDEREENEVPQDSKVEAASPADDSAQDDDDLMDDPLDAEDETDVETTDTATNNPQIMLTTPSSLSPEDEADLQTELAAALAAEDEVQNLAEATAPEFTPESKPETEAHADDPRAPDLATNTPDEAAIAEEDDAADALAAMLAEAEVDARKEAAAQTREDAPIDMERLMQQADRELATAETGRKQNAIAHLKAAVASKAADLAAGFGNGNADQTDEYRADLADAVRPAPAAPLKLVAEQRVDIPQAPEPAMQDEDTTLPVRPVRPRRVVRGAKPAAQQTSAASPQTAPPKAPISPTTTIPAFQAESFSEFAAQMGAHGLPDLLEAAAVYLAVVEGQPTFSRPQVMSKASSASDDGFSREDGLRSFGQLLRQGKFQKQKPGQFVVQETSRFNPNQEFAPLRREA
ncbi:hypothetical protein [Nereida ignava]|uniref:hypothetical protein n=1 Tax=Nereida ignava TaxID=282199 RepID=UPI0023B54FEF